jgi:beta-glucosidase
MKRLTWIVLVSVLVCIFCGCGSSEKALCSKIALGAHTAVTPVSRSEPSWWMQRHQGVLDKVQHVKPEVIFIGDSITHGWDNKGKEVWDQYYAEYNPVNMGFSGDRTEHVLWRLENGEIDGISPKLAVLMIGTNNAARDQYTPEQIAEGVKTIVCTLRAKLPKTKVLILAIFPRGSDDQRKDKTQDATPNPLWAKNDQVNQMISRFANGKTIFYLDINKAFLNDQGVLTRDVMPDLLHPDQKGYAVWAQAMEPTLTKLLK